MLARAGPHAWWRDPAPAHLLRCPPRSNPPAALQPGKWAEVSRDIRRVLERFRQVPFSERACLALLYTIAATACPSRRAAGGPVPPAAHLRLLQLHAFDTDPSACPPACVQEKVTVGESAPGGGAGAEGGSGDGQGASVKYLSSRCAGQGQRSWWHVQQGQAAVSGFPRCCPLPACQAPGLAQFFPLLPSPAAG